MIQHEQCRVLMCRAFNSRVITGGLRFVPYGWGEIRYAGYIIETG